MYASTTTPHPRATGPVKATYSAETMLDTQLNPDPEFVVGPGRAVQYLAVPVSPSYDGYHVWMQIRDRDRRRHRETHRKETQC